MTFTTYSEYLKIILGRSTYNSSYRGFVAGYMSFSKHSFALAITSLIILCHCSGLFHMVLTVLPEFKLGILLHAYFLSFLVTSLRIAKSLYDYH